MHTSIAFQWYIRKVKIEKCGCLALFVLFATKKASFEIILPTLNLARMFRRKTCSNKANLPHAFNYGKALLQGYRRL